MTEPSLSSLSTPQLIIYAKELLERLDRVGDRLIAYVDNLEDYAGNTDNE